VSRRHAVLLGYPVSHSVSPAMHNAAFASLAIDAQYEARAVPAEGLGDAVRGLRDPAYLGANVTVPHKGAVVPFLDALAEEARLLGAVNTIVRRPDGSLVGDNTDAAGLQRWLVAAGAGVVVAAGDCLVLGAGGAARATVMALARCGARSIRVLNRTPGRAAALAADLAPRLPDARLSAGPLAEAAAAGDAYAVVVNATSLGLHELGPDVHPTRFGPGGWAVDLAYNPSDTPFMRTARVAGGQSENGLGMLVHQAALSFYLWTGAQPPLALLASAAVAALGGAAHAVPGVRR